MQVLKIENGVAVMKEIFLSSLKKLLDEIEYGELTDINRHLTDCWKEFSLREKDTTIPTEVISKNKEILEKLTTVLRQHKERPISEENLHLIRTTIFEEQPKQQGIESENQHLKREISDMNNLLKEIERKMRKEKNTYKD